MRHRLFTLLARSITRAPWLVVGIALVLTAGSVWLGSTRLVTNTDQDDLLSERLDYHRRYKEFLREFGDQEYLYVVVHADEDPARARTFVDALIRRLETMPNLRQVLGRISASDFEQSALLHLSTEQLTALTSLLQTDTLAPTRLATWDGLDDPIGAIAHLLSQPMDSVGSEAETAMQPAFQFLSQFLEDLRATAEGPGGTAYRSPWQALLTKAPSTGLDAKGYITAGQGRFFFVLIMPQKDFQTLEVIAKPLADIRSALEETKRLYPGQQAGLTGLPVLAADEMSMTNRDMTIATILALCAVTLLFVLFLRRLTRPLFALLALIAGISWTFGFATLAVGSLNLLSTVFSVILVGAGFEFGLHLVTRYREELAHGTSPVDAITAMLTHTARGNCTAALTTAAAFYAAMLTDFEALRQLGLIAGTGILLCLISMLTLLPALLYLRDRRSTLDRTRDRSNLVGLLPLYRHPRALLWGSILLLIAATPFAWRVDFDHNLLNLKADGLESVRYEQLITSETEASTFQAVFLTTDAEAAQRVADEASLLPTVGGVESLRDLIPPNQAAKLALLDHLTIPEEVISLRPTTDQINAANMLSALTRLQFQLAHLADQALRSGRILAVRELERLEELTNSIRTAMRSGNPRVSERLGQYQLAFMTDFQKLLARLLRALNAKTVTIQDLPPLFRDRYLGASGRQAVYVTPKEDVWDPTAMAAFIDELRTIDPHVTGVPVEIYESSRLLERSFQFVAALALGIIFVLVALDFRSLRMATFALIPLFFGLGWLFGLMGLFGIHLNLANFFAIPILIGVGIDNGVQIMHRARQNHGDAPHVMTTSTGLGVILTSLTTLASFGMLMFASHRGIQSLGVVMAIGIVTIMIGAVVVLPAMLSLNKPRASSVDRNQHRRSSSVFRRPFKPALDAH